MTQGSLITPSTSTGNPYTNPHLHDDRTHQLIGGCTALIVLPTLAVFLRLLSRWISHAGYWWDDFVIVIAMICSWGPNVLNLVAIKHGFGKHLATQPIGVLFYWFKILYSFEFFYTLAMNFVKCSIILFLYRIFPIQQFRTLLNYCTAFVTCLTIACVTVSIFQCTPIHDFWDTLAGKLGGKCINVELYFLVSGSINTVTDFALLALPIPILWRLRTGKPQKLVLTGIFTMGLTVCAVSIVRLVVLANVDLSDITWNYVPVAIWTAAEPSIAVVSACLPSLRPLFVRLIWNNYTHIRPRTRSSHPSSSSYSNSHSWARKEKSRNSFNRLQELSSGSGNHDRAAHNVNVYGGRDKGKGDWQVGQEEYDLGDREREMSETAESEVPLGRIRAKTEVVVSISERVDWKDDLF